MCNAAGSQFSCIIKNFSQDGKFKVHRANLNSKSIAQELKQKADLYQFVFSNVDKLLALKSSTCQALLLKVIEQLLHAILKPLLMCQLDTCLTCSSGAMGSDLQLGVHKAVATC